MTDRIDRLSARRFRVALAAVFVAALALRTSFPLADPPADPPIGITWHDEGVWAHNARNRALFGAWRVDAWNPMFVSPVFTGVEYAAFAVLGVGWRQARAAPALAGAVSVVLIGLAVARFGGRRAGLLAAVFLATNYTWVMYTRVALLEGLMIAALVVSFWMYAKAEDRPAWGAAAGVFAILAFMTKASAAFFPAALGVLALIDLAAPRARVRGAWTMGGLAAATLAALALFIAPNWSEYWWYNLQVYGARRSDMSLNAMVMRASWFPVIHDFFTRAWLLTALAVCALGAIAVRLRTATAAERLLALWVVLGSAELVLHDLGNERRYVFLLPAMAALAALAIERDRRIAPIEIASTPAWTRWAAAPFVAFALYMILGGLIRVPLDHAISPSVRASAALAALLTTLLLSMPLAAAHRLGARWPRALATALAVVVIAGDAWQFGRWASRRTYFNYDASAALNDALPDGALVQGKLANGLALENRIRPLFIGPGFGNYADRLTSDARFILTYTYPKVGYEGVVIQDVLDANPGWRIVREFPVLETPSGRDRAALIEKPHRP